MIDWRGLASHFSIHTLIAKGMKKEMPPVLPKRGGGGENEQLQYQIRDKDQNKTRQINKDLC